MPLLEKKSPKPALVNLRCQEGYLCFSEQEWLDTIKLLRKKNSELVEPFKARSIQCKDHVVVNMVGSCLFLDKSTSPFGCHLKKLLHICPGTCELHDKEE